MSQEQIPSLTCVLFEDVHYKMAVHVREELGAGEEFLSHSAANTYPLGEEMHPHSLVITYWDHGVWSLVK